MSKAESKTRDAKAPPIAPLQERMEAELANLFTYLSSHRKFLVVSIAALLSGSENHSVEVAEVLDTEVATRFDQELVELRSIVGEIEEMRTEVHS